MKKKLLVFILVFCLSTCGFVRSDPVKEVKASVTAVAVSLFLLGLTALGVSYYTSTGSDALSNDIDAYASSNDTTSANYLNAFQSVVVDTAKNAVKYTAAQVYLLTDFAQYLTNNNKVSEVPISSESFETVPLMGYPSLIKVGDGDTFYLHSNFDNSYRYFTVNTVNPTDEVYIGFVSTIPLPQSVDNTHNSVFRVFALNLKNGNIPNISYKRTVDGSSAVLSPVGSEYINNMHGVMTYFYFGNFYSNLLGSSNWYNLGLNDKIFTNLFFTNALESGHDENNFKNALKLRFGYSSTTATYSGNLTLPSYSVNKEVLSNIATDKDLVITSPDLIDKAVDNAIVRNPSATSITVEDVAAAIDSTAVGVIDPAAEDEQDKVIAPPISLDDELSISQDSAITDTVVEDLVIGDPLPPPDPPPVLPDIDVALGSKFPFSVFYDFVAIMCLFDATPIAPSFPLGFEFLGNEYEFTIDLSAFDSVARVLRLMELIAFISGLVFLTIRYIRGKD